MEKSKVKVWAVIFALVILCVATAGYALFLAGELKAKESGYLVVDDMGRVVKVPMPVSRVVSTAPSNTEILFAVGAGGLVVGVDNYSDYPEEAKNITKVGDFATPNVELILSLKPDVIFAYYGQRPAIEKLESLGMAVVTIRPQNLDDILKDIMLIGTICGKQKNASELVEHLKARIENITKKTANLTDEQRPKVYYELWNNPFMSAGPGSFINDLIRLAGGKNIAANASRDYPVLTEEYILYANPDIIITSNMNLDTPEKIMQRANWQNVNAVKNRKVYAVDDNLVNRPGPRIVDGLEELAKLIHPEIFGGSFA